MIARFLPLRVSFNHCFICFVICFVRPFLRLPASVRTGTLQQKTHEGFSWNLGHRKINKPFDLWRWIKQVVKKVLCSQSFGNANIPRNDYFGYPPCQNCIYIIGYLGDMWIFRMCYIQKPRDVLSVLSVLQKGCLAALLLQPCVECSGFGTAATVVAERGTSKEGAVPRKSWGNLKALMSLVCCFGEGCFFPMKVYQRLVLRKVMHLPFEVVGGMWSDPYETILCMLWEEIISQDLDEFWWHWTPPPE